MSDFNDKNSDLLEGLDHIDPAALSYQDWVSVGMGLKEAGYPASAWEDWSRRDPQRYHAGECTRKWETFNGTMNGAPVTGATVAKMAMDAGWRPSLSAPGYSMDWDSEISDAPEDHVVVDKAWLESEDVLEPADSAWSPAQDLIAYINTLFSPDDFVGYVTETFENEGREARSNKGKF